MSKDREPVVITEALFLKGRPTYTREKRIDWVCSPEDEESIARAVRSTGARMVVLGVTRYRGDLYSALCQEEDRPALIARHGVGYDGIDLDLCSKHGIYLTITPGTLDRSVAEHSFALLLAAVRHISTLDALLKEGRFESRMGRDLFGKTLGIAGLGNIGTHVAAIASRGFGMTVHAFDTVPLEDKAIQEGTSPEEYLSRFGIKEYFTEFEPFAQGIDFLSIHMPLVPATKGFFNTERLSRLKPGAVLINTSRGGLIDEEALHACLAGGQIGAAGLDVYQQEPYRPVSEALDLRRLPNVVLTPHVASNTEEALHRMAEKVLENIRFFREERFDMLSRVV